MATLSAYTDNVHHVAHGKLGQHYVKLFVDIFDLTPGNTAWVSLDGGMPVNKTSDLSFSYNLPISGCCGLEECGYVVSLEERDSSGVSLPDRLITTANPVELCPSDYPFSAQNPKILTCNVLPGTNVQLAVQSIPVAAGYIINAYLDGDNSYNVVATAITDSTGIATLVIPTAVNGQKYWISEQIDGYQESFGSSVVVGGACSNLQINPNYTCGTGGATVYFSPTGGSGNYSYSLTNYENSGYLPLATIYLQNGENKIYVRDNLDFNKKVMYSVLVDCPYIYNAVRCDTGAPAKVSYPLSSYATNQVVMGQDGACYRITGLGSGVANTRVASNYLSCEACILNVVIPDSGPNPTGSSAPTLRIGMKDDNIDSILLQQNCNMVSFQENCSLATPYTEKRMSVHAMADRMSLVFPYYKFKKRIPGKLLSGVYEIYIQYESKNGQKSNFHKYKNRVFVTQNVIDGSLPGKTLTQVPNAYKYNHHNRQMGVSGEQTAEGLQFEVNDIDTRWDYINFIYAHYETDTEPVEVREFSHTKITASSILIDLVENSGLPIPKERLSQRFQNILSAKATFEEGNRKVDLGIEYLPEITVDYSSVTIDTKLRLLEQDSTIEPVYSATYNPVSKKDNNDPLTNTLPTNTVINIQRNSLEAESLSVIDDYNNYKGQQVESSLVGHWRGETYPFAVVLVDNKGNDLFAQPIKEFTFPEQFSGPTNQEYSLTKLVSGKWNSRILGAIINGIKLDPDKIYKKRYNSITCKYERTDELLISGFKIVRGDRFKTIEHQGVVFNTVEVDNKSTADKKDARIYPLPTADNRFSVGYVNSVNKYQYGDGHEWVPNGSLQNIAQDVADGSGKKEKPTSSPYWITYHSPDVYIEGKIREAVKDIDKLQHVGMAHKGYTKNLIELLGGHAHFYTKNYDTYNKLVDPLTTYGRPKLGDITRIEKSFEVEKNFDTEYKDFDDDNPYKTFHPGAGTYFYGNKCFWVGNANRDTVMIKIKDFDSVDIIKDSNSFVSTRIVNYKIPTSVINKETIQYYSIGHFQQINQTVLNAAVKELNADGSVSKYVFNNIEVWGGDCYVNLFDFSRLYPKYSQGCKQTCDGYPDYAFSMIVPIESKYNIALKLGRGFAQSATQAQKQSCENILAERHFSDGIMNQQPEDWNYNRVLNVHEKIRFYQQKPTDQEIISNDESGVVFSPVKIFGEKQDQYRTNLVLDYYSLNGTNGSVMRAVKAHGYVYVVQERGFGVLPINQRAFIPSSEGEITVRSGNVISDVRYISNIYGTQHPRSVWVNNNYIGFVDARMGKQMFFSQAGLAKMSTNNNMDDHMTMSTIYNDSNQELKTIMNKAQDIVACYDFEHEEVLTSFIGYPNNFALAYSIELSAYTQFFDYVPKMMFNIGRYLFSNSGNKVLLHNYGRYGHFDDIYYKSIVRFIVAPSPTVSKVFDNGRINVNKEGVNRITRAFLKTQNEIHNITLHASGILIDDRAEYFENDLVFPMHEEDIMAEKSRLRDHYLEVTLEIENADYLLDGIDKRVVISNFDTRYRISFSNAYVE